MIVPYKAIDWYLENPLEPIALPGDIAYRLEKQGIAMSVYESEGCIGCGGLLFYENGSVMYIEQFEKGIWKQGKYYKKGASQLISEVIDGSGTATIFDPFGNIEKQIVYDKGHAILD